MRRPYSDHSGTPPRPNASGLEPHAVSPFLWPSGTPPHREPTGPSRPSAATLRPRIATGTGASSSRDGTSRAPVKRPVDAAPTDGTSFAAPCYRATVRPAAPHPYRDPHRGGTRFPSAPLQLAPRRTCWMPKTLNAYVAAPRPVSRPRGRKIS